MIQPTFGLTTFNNATNTEKSPTSLTSTISFASPTQFSFTPKSTFATEQQGTTEDNDDGKIQLIEITYRD